MNAYARAMQRRRSSTCQVRAFLFGLLIGFIVTYGMFAR